MLVSVIVPTYNRKHMVATAVQSILNQTYRDLEIIVVDDGSTDSTEQTIRRIAAGASRPIRYVKKPNGGCASARNAGIKHAKGDAVAFLDSDDQFLPEALESQVSTLKSSGADFVYSPSIEVSARGKEVISIPAAPHRPEKFAWEHFFNLCARSCCVLYRRLIFEKFQFDETARYNEDSDFLQRVAITFKAAYSPMPTARVFQHGGNKSSNQKEIYRALLKSYESILRDNPAFMIMLGPLASMRLDNLKTDLIEVLVEQGELAEARTVTETMSRVNTAVSLGLRFSSGLPFLVRRYYCLLMHIARRAPVVVLEKLTPPSGEGKRR